MVKDLGDKKVKRPVLRYHGGKWRLASWIISHFPEHKVYVEPFGGAASVLLKKNKSMAEVYNDLDDYIVHVFRVLRDEKLGKKLAHQILFTPFSKLEFDKSYNLNISDPVEKARRIIVRSFFGFTSSSVTSSNKTGFRSSAFKSHKKYSAGDWLNYPEAIPGMIKRLKEVCIESIDGVHCIKKYDRDQTLFYVDPPYMLSTRHKAAIRGEYRLEMDDFEHENLLRQLLRVKGKVILSGYDNNLYNNYLKNWRRSEKMANAQKASGGSKKTTEILWMNF